MSENTSLTNTKVDQFKDILNQQTIRAQLCNTLHKNAGAFASSMIDLYSGDNYLQKCDPQAVAIECLKAASLKLPLVKSLGFAYVVPYKNKPTFTIGYKGLIQLAQRSGQYRTINADTVYEGELVKKDKLSGTIDLSGEKTSDKVIGYFAYIETISGFQKTLYMSKEEVRNWAKEYSPSYNSDSTPWKKEFDKMAQKTVLRRLLGTYGPKSMDIQMQAAISNDDRGMTPQQEAKANANKKLIDIDPDTGEVIEPAESATEAEEPPKNDKGKTTQKPTESKPADDYDPGF